jgi:hypothetical protein
MIELYQCQCNAAVSSLSHMYYVIIIIFMQTRGLDRGRREREKKKLKRLAMWAAPSRGERNQ